MHVNSKLCTTSRVNTSGQITKSTSYHMKINAYVYISLKVIVGSLYFLGPIFVDFHFVTGS